MPGEDLERLAADPTTPLTTLHQLARDHPRARPAIAANPSTYPALLEWLAMLGVPEVDAALAARVATSVLTAHPAPAPGLPPSYPPPRHATASRAPETAPALADRAEPPTVALPAAGGAAPVLPPVFPPAAPAPQPRVRLSPEPAQSATAHVTGVPATPVQGVAMNVPTRSGAGVDAGTGGIGAGPADERPAARGTADEGPSASAHLPRWLLPAGIAVVAFVLLAWAFGPPTGASSTAPPNASSGTSAPPGDPAAASAALAALPGTTSCGDVTADAQVFANFGTVASIGDAWQDPASADVVINALVGLQDACDPAYALAVNNALIDGDATPAAVRATLTTAGDWLAPARPAPADAQQRNAFVSPTGNIACGLGEGTATCTITERAFADPQTCGPGPVTLVVGVGGDARPDCAAPAAAGGDGLAYDQSVTAGHFACLSKLDGVTCWSTLTGHGFTVARAGFSTF
ncbi:hypothetical protein FE374_17865 [Georgenia yuyongxinii]|uniref:Leucine rich repeat variant domain-containing protein n=1 Tax=Georgenia yuyongxinii TaxID=2589797 RepID=A0A5B8C9T4_9MICO|nr:hypothetical protein [Georgenia yuyongxinii]QDC26225.1 hypothetical protein FE374_17865 [Georgenia yuyongxinii]